MIDEEYEIRTSYLVLFTLFLLGPNILLVTLFLSTFELCTFVWVTDQLSHTYKTIKCKGGIVFVHAMEGYTGRRDTAVLILKFSTIWRGMVNIMPRLL